MRAIVRSDYHHVIFAFRTVRYCKTERERERDSERLCQLSKTLVTDTFAFLAVISLPEVFMLH